MWNYNYSSVLEHAGIKGQKWGVRRFQNEDRTWTEAGKKRYGKKTGFLQRASEKRTAKKAKKEADKRAKIAEKYEKERKLREKEEAKRAEEERRKNETLEEKKARILKKHDPREVAANMDLFTNEELRDVTTRLQLEKSLKELSPKEKDKGEEFVKSMEKTAKGLSAASNMVTSGSNLYNSVAKIVNSTSDADWPIIGEKVSKMEKATKQMKAKIAYNDTVKELKKQSSKIAKEIEELEEKNRLSRAKDERAKYDKKKDEYDKRVEELKKQVEEARLKSQLENYQNPNVSGVRQSDIDDLVERLRNLESRL